MHNSFPVVPVTRAVSDDELSPYAKELWLQMHPSATGRLKGRAKRAKLITDLHDKCHHVVHYRNHKQYIKLGLQIKEIHKVVEFDQDTWSKCHIDYNTQKRKDAETFLTVAFSGIRWKTKGNMRWSI